MNIPLPLQPFFDMKAVEELDEIVSDLDYDALYDLLELLDMRRAMGRSPEPPAGIGGHRDPTSPEGVELRAYLKGVLKEHHLGDRDRLLLFLHLAIRDQIIPGLDADRVRRLVDLVRRFHGLDGRPGEQERPGGEVPPGDPSLN